ncbi:MAG: glycoside hydrolase family 95 protein [Clostridia bacterium]|nr:glycoside hydrolase family 95 protein [Clostridia bacterium]
MFLCYSTPANMSYFGWENEALPLGNGRIGAKVFGGPDCELITLNEKTLWSGGPATPQYHGGIKNGDGGKTYRAVRDLLLGGEIKKAQRAMDALQGDEDGSGDYQAFGSLYLQFDDFGAADHYVRDLELDSASAMVNFRAGKAVFSRHYFVSYPDNVMAGRLEAAWHKQNEEEDGEEPPPPTFSFNAYFVSEQKGESVSAGDTITVEGTVQANRGVDGEPTENANGMRYGGAIRFIPQDGTVTATENGQIRVENTSSVVFVLSLATDYQNSYPRFSDGSDPLRDKALPAVDAAAKQSFGQLYRTHLDDYRPLFRAVEFKLGEEQGAHPVDFMLKRFDKKGEFKRPLIALLFQYGRYLLLSSSREGTLPANLQGIWNAKNDPPWRADYHMNINLQMNYWPAYAAGVPAAAGPFRDYVASLRRPGRLVAAKTLGVGRAASMEDPALDEPTGWVAHTQTGPLGMCGPGSDWRWGWEPTNGAWAAVQMYDCYAFDHDFESLKTTVYPTMEESSRLFSQQLCEDKRSGRLVNAPGCSPEQGPATAGCTYDQTILYALFDAVIDAAGVMEAHGCGDQVDRALVKTLKAQKDRLQPLQVGKHGQLKEWFDEDGFPRGGKGYGVEKLHRHISHLLGLYPFALIDDDTPGLQKAAKVSLRGRGDKTTGWAMAHRLCCWARLRDGEQCDEMIATILKTAIMKNLFGTHPPFQIDGNFGFTAGVAEMLLQSHNGLIRILPALPKDWRSGSVTGLHARGNITVGMTWDLGRLKTGTLCARDGGTVRLLYDGKIVLVQDADGAEIETDFEDGVTTFSAKPGETYTFS